MKISAGKFSGGQRGVVLLVGLVMLMMVTLMAVTGFNIVKVNQQVAGNMESRAQAMTAANAAIEEAISSTLFFNQPGNIFLDSCGGANTKCYDFNGDGVNDVTVAVSNPTCVTVEPRTNDQVIKAGKPGCQIGGEGDDGQSMCVVTVWDMEAVAIDELTGASATVRQGVEVWASRNNVASACPD